MGGQNSGKGPKFKTSLLSNGPVTMGNCVALNMSYVGCPLRGTTKCLWCELGELCQLDCDYLCHLCMSRLACPCGWKDEGMQRAMFEKEMQRRRDVLERVGGGVEGA
jgi:hypothetical protein